MANGNPNRTLSQAADADPTSVAAILSDSRQSVRLVLIVWLITGGMLFLVMAAAEVARWRAPHNAAQIVEILDLNSPAIAPSGTAERSAAHAHPAVVPAQIPCAPEVLSEMSGSSSR